MLYPSSFRHCLKTHFQCSLGATGGPVASAIDQRSQVFTLAGKPLVAHYPSFETEPSIPLGEKCRVGRAKRNPPRPPATAASTVFRWWDALRLSHPTFFPKRGTNTTSHSHTRLWHTPMKLFAVTGVIFAALFGLMWSYQAHAIQPNLWEHTTEADFAAGMTEDTVVTNLGDVKLATQTTVLGQIPEKASVIYDLQSTRDGNLYLAVGPEAAILRRDGVAIEEVLAVPDAQIFCLDVTGDGKLLVAVSSDLGCRVATLDGPRTSNGRGIAG